MIAKFPEITVLYKLDPNFPETLTTVALERVNCGFPSPAADYVEQSIDLNKHLIKNINETFLIRANSQSMRDVGISTDDLMVVDRALNPESEDVVIAVINNEFTVKTLIIENHDTGRKVWLRAENPDFQDIHPAECEELLVWGVVTAVVKDLFRPRKKAK